MFSGLRERGLSAQNEIRIINLKLELIDQIKVRIRLDLTEGTAGTL